MIQIVGKDQRYIKRTTCQNCSSILEYTQSEIMSKDKYDYTGDKDTVYYLKCPCCSHEVTVTPGFY